MPTVPGRLRTVFFFLVVRLAEPGTQIPPGDKLHLQKPGQISLMVLRLAEYAQNAGL